MAAPGDYTMVYEYYTLLELEPHLSLSTWKQVSRSQSSLILNFLQCISEGLVKLRRNVLDIKVGTAVLVGSYRNNVWDAALRHRR